MSAFEDPIVNIPPPPAAMPPQPEGFIDPATGNFYPMPAIIAAQRVPVSIDGMTGVPNVFAGQGPVQVPVDVASLGNAGGGFPVVSSTEQYANYMWPMLNGMPLEPRLHAKSAKPPQKKSTCAWCSTIWGDQE